MAVVVLAILAVFGLLLAALYFAVSVTALAAVSKGRAQALTSQESPEAVALNRLIGQRERVTGAALLGNILVSVLAVAIATWLTLRLVDNGAILVASVAMTVAILIFSQLLPRRLAVLRAERIALAIARPMCIVTAILAPVVSALQLLTARILHLFGMRPLPEATDLSVDHELRDAIDFHHQEGTVEREQRQMLGGILDLRQLRVADVMVHRKNMVVIDAHAAIAESVELVLSSGHTRYPIWKDDPENIVGVLHTKDLLRLLAQRRGSLEGLDIMALATEPWFVPDTTTLDEQVHAFQKRRAHFALVVDEYGTLQGLITLEDILEEVFGDIAEAYDTETPEGIRRQPDGSLVVDGVTPIRELNREFEWLLPDEEATTIAGLVICEARIIPEVGQIFSFHDFKFEVLRRQRNQVTALRITPPRRGARGEPRGAAHAP
jgi:Mg2+/Co2+ transporter CorB